MPYLRNAWYAIAWSDDVGRELFHRTVMDEPILVYRKTDGVAVALSDRCPHRFAPLHAGRLIGDTVQCAYHGLQFDSAGICIHNAQPGGTVPRGACVRSYPLHEQDGLLWVWMGDQPSDLARLPRFEHHDTGSYAMNRSHMVVNANYQLVADNIMDTSHVQFVHDGLLSTPTYEKILTEVREAEDGTVFSDRFITKATILPHLDPLWEVGGEPVDHWFDLRWNAPASMRLSVGVTACGAAKDAGRLLQTTHIMTPETDGVTHYFWAVSRAWRRDDAILHENLQKMFTFAFETQDKPLIEEQQRLLGKAEFWSLKPILLKEDAGAERTRRLLDRMMKKEAARVETPAHA
jgi:phenylpropionate dioxygenase-like ring-hydroxylating dioxygenase large terminal subunit